jgi:hypothetical protein
MLNFIDFVYMAARLVIFFYELRLQNIGGIDCISGCIARTSSRWLLCRRYCQQRASFLVKYWILWVSTHGGSNQPMIHANPAGSHRSTIGSI